MTRFSRLEHKHDDKLLLLQELRNIKASLEAQQGQINDLRLINERNVVPSSNTVVPSLDHATLPEMTWTGHRLTSNQIDKKRSRSDNDVNWYVRW